ncbi:MAG: heme exporter protein CcmB [Candidatus Marinimicrobia bacterium]|nr:heme exporter protein CcmB [Candidatus Neomarinimicrobiota bacterium]
MFLTLLKKELFVELRNKEVILSMLAFGLTVLLIFSFSLSGNPKINHEMAPGLFWSLVVLSSSLGLHRLFGQEKDFDAFASLLSAPIDRGTLFLAKWMSGILFLSIIEILVVLPFFLFLGLSQPMSYLPGIGIVLLGNLGIVAVGVIVSGLAMRAKMSAVLLPVLLFPLITPLLIACVKATTGWYHQLMFNYWQFWVLIMATYVVIFGLAGYVFFDHITEE